MIDVRCAVYIGVCVHVFHSTVVSLDTFYSKWKVIILNEKYLFGNKFLENNVKVFLVQKVWEGILDLNSGEKYFYIFAIQNSNQNFVFKIMVECFKT